MIQCNSCTTDNVDSNKFCSECGAALKAEYVPTEALGQSGDRVREQSDVAYRSAHGRFLPGAVVADRYRIVSLLGKGGMGEVYRADDLKLGHPVALKFLPKNLASEAWRLEYFHNEVRLTRQISHPNVCRVYDIGEFEGQQYLSMEYVDGEDLRGLLRRIGKLPQDKGIQIAHQLCLGLAAAHDRGILHRDLKPDNIMLDGRGQVRITDFGLAKLMDESTAGEIAGTPVYMAPEQLVGGEVSIQSDLYALGLILFELFTGQAARQPASIQQLIRDSRESSLSQTLNLPAEIDPSVGRVISQCLEHEPHERPISANAVAANMPGGDPLAAALAAGETPSPELVAASGDKGLLSIRTASVCLAVVVIGLALLVWRRGTLSPTQGVNKSAADYAEDARQKLRSLGWIEKASDYEYYRFSLAKIPSAFRPQSSVVQFWYRRSPVLIAQERTVEMAFNPRVQISPQNPPHLVPGMVAVRLNRAQQLRELLVVPPSTPIDSQRLTNRSDEDLDKRRFEIVAPAFAENELGFPLTDDDAEVDRFSQVGRFSLSPVHVVRPPFVMEDYFELLPETVEDQETIERIEVGLLDGKIGYLNVVEKSLASPHFSPWRSPPKTPEVTWLTGIRWWTDRVAWTISLLITPITILLAWRNVKLVRSDRKTAWRVAVFMFCVVLLKSRLDAGFHLEMLRQDIMLAAGKAFQIWVWYLALEPVMRKFWPGILTSWTRVMTGRWNDPSLGTGLLIGIMAGVLVPLINVLLRGEAATAGMGASALSGFGGALSTVLAQVRFVMGWGLYLAIVLVICRILTKRNWAAGLLSGCLLMVFWQFDYLVNPTLFTVVIVLYLATSIVFLTRFGLVSTYSFLVFNHMLTSLPTSSDRIGPDVLTTILAIVVVVAVAGYGFYTSVGGRKGFANQLGVKSLV